MKEAGSGAGSSFGLKRRSRSRRKSVPPTIYSGRLGGLFIQLFTMHPSFHTISTLTRLHSDTRYNAFHDEEISNACLSMTTINPGKVSFPIRICIRIPEIRNNSRPPSTTTSCPPPPHIRTQGNVNTKFDFPMFVFFQLAVKSQCPEQKNPPRK